MNAERWTMKLTGAICMAGCVTMAVAAAPAVGMGRVANLRLPFVANEGQLADAQISFYCQTFYGSVLVTKNGTLVYVLPKFEAVRPEPPALPRLRPPAVSGISILKEYPVGARAASPAGENRSDAAVNYFKGDRSRWKSNLAACETLVLGEIYAGITLCLKAYDRNVEKVLTLAPGADPAEIEFRVEGADRLALTAAGELLLDTALGEARFSAPIAWQEQDGARQSVEVAYRVAGDRYGFEVGEYDDSRPLVIDPLLASTFLGGAKDDYPGALARDASGNIYLAGYSRSADYPTTPGVYDPTYNGYPHTNGYIVDNDYDVVISKLNASFTQLLASTYLGGRHEDEATAIQLDEAGNVYVTGYTKSYNFPVTPGAYNTNFNGGIYTPPYEGDAEIFISKLDAALTNLVASTFLGGTTDDDIAYAMALSRPDSSLKGGDGYVYLTGSSGSSNFPVTPGAYNTNARSIFISKMDLGLSDLVTSTFLGDGIARCLAVDAAGNIYVAGSTASNNFPVTAGAYQTTLNGTNTASLCEDAFVSQLDEALINLLASTFLGGGYRDAANILALDPAGNVVIAGELNSHDFPVTPGAYDNGWTIRWAGEYDGFVSKFNSNLTGLVASTCLGGSSRDYAYALAIDNAGNVFVGGSTESLYNPSDWLNFPVTPGAYNTRYHTWSNESATLPDAFISKFDTRLTNLMASTLLGGSVSDYLSVLLLDPATNVIAAGYTESDDFPVLPGAYATNRHGGKDIFLSKLDAALSGETSALLPPANVTASSGTYIDKVQVAWSTVTNATSYEVWRNTSLVASSAYRLADTAAIYYNDTAVAAGLAYYYWIKSKNAAGFSAFSTGVSGYALSQATPTVLAADFDGDWKADPALYVASSGTWHIKLSSSGYGLITLPYGNSNYAAVARDFDGDLKADPALYKMSNGKWKVALSRSGYAEASLNNFGGPDYRAVAGDYDGDGLADPAVYHTANGDWYVALSGQGYAIAGVSGFGGAGYAAVEQNYDSDRRFDPAVYRESNGNWTILLSAANYITATLWGFGGTGYEPVMGDFDGDGKADPAVYNAAAAALYVRTSGSGYNLATLSSFGGAGYLVSAADFDGDRKADPTLLDLATGVWHIRLSGGGYSAATLPSGWTP